MIIVIIFIIDVLCAICLGFAGRKRKFGYWGYFFASLLLTPVIGLLLVIASEPPLRPVVASKPAVPVKPTVPVKPAVVTKPLKL